LTKGDYIMTSIYILILAAIIEGKPQVVAPFDFATLEQCEQAGQEAVQHFKESKGLEVLALCARRDVKGKTS
jgi:hypothetical protein